jgi:hypothetical protein
VVVSKFREILLVHTWRAHNIDIQRFSVKKLSMAQVREEYKLKTANVFETLECKDDNENMDIT